MQIFIPRRGCSERTMSASQASGNVDHTVRLPDEMLCSVISYIPSLPHRFKLAAVNNKFRRCVMGELNKPIPLNINFYYGTLNGQKIPIHRWPQAVQALVPKTCFTRISIVGYQKADQLLYPLAVSECLDRVRVFELVDLPGFIYDPSILTKVLVQCQKLSIFRLDFQSRPLASPTAPPSIRALALCSILANKPLCQLKLKLYDYNHDQLTKLFESLEPKMLHSLDLSFEHMQCPNFVDLVSRSGAAWSGLREMRLYYGPDIAVQHLDGFFSTVVPRLPLLQSCTIECRSNNHQVVVTGLMALFNNSERQQPIIVQNFFYCSAEMNPLGIGMFGHAAVNLFTQLKQFHPDIQIDFDDKQVRIKLNSVTWTTVVLSTNHCVQCRRVYTVVLRELLVQSQERRSMHLAGGYRLDRCKVNRILMDVQYALYNVDWQGLDDCYLAPSSSVMNEAGDLVVITIEDLYGDPFHITIDCGQCLYENCIGCLVV